MSVRLLIVWLHVVGVVVWVGGLMYQAHVLAPAARGGNVAMFADLARRGRAAAWTAIAVVVLTGFYNVTQLGSVERAMQSGAGLLLVAKFGLVILAVALAGQRDFAQLTILRHAVDSGADPTSTLKTITRLDRIVLTLSIVIVYLGLAISRA